MQELVEHANPRLEYFKHQYDEKYNGSSWNKESENIFRCAPPSQSSLPAGVYMIAYDSRGCKHVKLDSKYDDIILLPDSASIEVANTISKFWNSKAKFDAIGVLWKRGVLLHGKPGTGKTACISLIIKDLIERNGVAFICAEPEDLLTGINLFRMVEPERPLICIYEDIEEIIYRYGEKGLLALLDGEYQSSNVLHIATTNYIENLPPRITSRPSRFDMVIEIKLPTLKSREEFIKYKFGNILDAKEIKNWAKVTDGLSIAHIKELGISTLILDNDFEESLLKLKGMKGNGKEIKGFTPVSTTNGTSRRRRRETANIE
jgi:AAA+ superfamily predicted ATPase